MSNRKEQVAEISGGLFFLSKAMGSHPYDYGFSAHLYELDKGNLASSYLKIAVPVNSEMDKIILNNPITIRSGIKFLEKFIQKLFDNKIGNYKYISWKVTDDIHLLYDWNIPDEFYVYDYHRSFECGEDKEICHQSGKSLFIPVEGKEFLVLHFHAKGKNSDILNFSFENTQQPD